MSTATNGHANGSAPPTTSGSPSGEAAIIALRGGPRASLRQRRARDFVADLLDRAGATKRVRALPAQQLAFLIRELGLGDALDLLRLAAPEQVQACLDIECWQRDRLDPERMQLWLEALAELGPANLGAVVAALDHELLVTFFAQRLRVYDLSCDEPPEEPEGHLYHTPDRFYTVDVIGGGAAVDRVLETLYMADPELGRRVIMGARWDVGAETEEAAYRFRSGRLADLGYVDHHDALRIYTFLDPRGVHPGPRPASRSQDEDTAALFLPPELADVLSNHAGLFSRAMAALAPAERAAITRELLYLLNQVLSAERIDPGDLSAARPELLAVVDTLCLALEYLATRDRGAGVAEHSPPAEPAAEPSPHVAGAPVAASASDGALDAQARAALAALRGVELSQLFRLGHSLTLQVARLASLLTRQGLTSLAPRSDPASLLDSPHAEVVRALAAPRRPRFARQLDRDAASEGAAPATRPFRGLRDIAAAVGALEEARAISDLLVRGLGLRLETLPAVLADAAPGAAQTRFSDILGTMVGNLLLQRPPAFVPLSPRDLPALRRAALGLAEGQGEGLSPAAEGTVLTVLRQRIRERSGGDEALWTPAAERWLRAALARLAQGLRGVPEQDDLLDLLPAVPGLVLRRPGAPAQTESVSS